MALGAITQNPVMPGAQSGVAEGPVVGNSASLKWMSISVVGDASYPTGGTAVSALTLSGGNLSVIVASQFDVQALSGTNSTVAACVYNLSTGKLQCYGASAEITNATNLSGATFQGLIWGY